eukprot:3499403-Prymnesium_polylepis.1
MGAPSTRAVTSWVRAGAASPHAASPAPGLCLRALVDAELQHGLEHLARGRVRDEQRRERRVRLPDGDLLGARRLQQRRPHQVGRERRERVAEGERVVVAAEVELQHFLAGAGQAE